MRYIPILLTLALCAAVTAVPALAQPRIEFKARSYDFGTVPPNSKLVHHFVFTNMGNEPLIIDSKVRTTCGCTAAVISATAIPASATGVVSVTMTAGITTMKMAKSSIVSSNDPNNPDVTLDTIANVRNVWSFSPQSDFAMGEVPFDSEKSMQLTMKNIDNEPFRIVGFKVNHPDLVSVKIGDPTPEGIPIAVTVKANKTKQLLSDTLELKTDHPMQSYYQADITANIVGYVKFVPTRIFFGGVAAGDMASREVSISLNKPGSEGELEIGEIASDTLAVTGKIMGKTQEGGVRVSLTVAAPETTGYRSGTIQIKTNCPEEPVATIPYSLIVKASSN
ncbi:MAG: DUF1573 domain-containing protein [Candidatus Omnitrophota bacterium]